MHDPDEKNRLQFFLQAARMNSHKGKKAEGKAARNAAFPGGCGIKKHPLGGSNNRNIPRGKRMVNPKAARYAAHLLRSPD